MYSLLQFLQPPEVRRRQHESLVHAVKHYARPFAEVRRQRPDRADNVYITAASWEPDNPLAALFPDAKPDRPILSPSGTWAYTLRTLPVGAGLPVGSPPNLLCATPQAFFDDDVLIPVLGRRSDGQSDYRPVMSLTPFEFWTLSGGVRAATGDVLLGGLGMGYMLKQVAAKRSVRSITVVERDAELLFWYGRRLVEQFPKVTCCLHGDAFEESAKALERNPETRIVLDVWDDYGRAAYDPRLQALRRFNPNAKIWAWGSARG